MSDLSTCRLNSAYCAASLFGAFCLFAVYSTRRGASTVRHNRHNVGGASGGTLIACDSGQLVAMNFGARREYPISSGDSYSESDYSMGGPGAHYNRPLHIDGGFLEAIKEACVSAAVGE